jgi:recombination protein RecR
MAYAVLGMRKEDREQFVDSIEQVNEKVHRCPDCGLYCEGEKCDVCLDPTRDHSLLCVVSEEKDAIAIEKTNSFHGLYHVLGGLLSASKGIGPSELSVDALCARVNLLAPKEVIVATSPTIDGQTTALFIAKILEDKGITVTRLGYGLPMGASLDYADRETLNKAFEGRKKL